jgi:hypothetical protein
MNSRIFKEKGYTYNPDTGEIFNPKGIKCGSLNNEGYVRIGTYFMGKVIQVSAHRFAWFYIHGEEPKIIDHINRVKTDNRLSNLRPITHRGNMSNRDKSKTSSKYTGVNWNESNQKWRVKIGINKKTVPLGYFNSEEEASEAYQNYLKNYLESNGN